MLIPLFLVLNLFLLRPFCLGEKYTTLGILVSGICFGIYCFKYNKIQIKRKALIIVGIQVLYYINLLCIYIINPYKNIGMIFNYLIIPISVITIYSIILSNQDINYRFYRYFIVIIILLCISTIITQILFLIINPNKLYLFTLPYSEQHYMNYGKVYFPFTSIYNEFNSGTTKLYRGLYFFREAGIAQAFIIWCIFNLKKYNLDRKINYIFLMFGLLFTYSTAGIIVISATFLLNILLNQKSVLKKIVGIIIVIILIVAANYAPHIGLQNKMITHGNSSSDRMEGIVNSFIVLANEPLGVGYNDGEVIIDKDTNKKLYDNAVGILSNADNVGVIGFLLSLSIFGVTIINNKDVKGVIVKISPLFLTALVFQPIYMDPGVIIFLLSCLEWEKKDISSIKCKEEELNNEYIFN